MLACRLFSWDTVQYFAPITLPHKHVFSRLAQRSQAMQLQLVMEHVEGACEGPMKMCQTQDVLSKARGFQLRSDTYSRPHSKQPVVWLQNSPLFLQKESELGHVLQYLAAYAEDGTLLQGSTDHYLVMSYSRANAKKTVEALVSAFAHASALFKVKAVYTTVQPLCVASASTGSSVPVTLPITQDSSLPYMLVVFTNAHAANNAGQRTTVARSAEHKPHLKSAALQSSSPASGAMGKRHADGQATDGLQMHAWSQQTAIWLVRGLQLPVQRRFPF